MSAHKRFYDKDSSNILGSYDADSNTSFSQVGATTTNNQTDWASKKRLRLEQEQLKQNQQQESRNNSTLVYRESWTNQSNSEANSDSENYEDIDYGGDDDDQNPELEEQQNQASRSVDTLLNCTRVDGIGKHELVEQHLKNTRVKELTEQQHQTDKDANEDLVNDEKNFEEREMADCEGHERTLQKRIGPPVNSYQPRKPCKMFPNCRFGKDCLYSHPLCKFNNDCIRPNCPFFHKTEPPAHKDLNISNPTSNNPEPTPPAQRLVPKTRYGPPSLKCKYGVHCVNQMCKFYHPSYQRFPQPSHHHHHAPRSDPCHFGANCLFEACPFTHPADAESKKPAASAFKWTALS